MRVCTEEFLWKDPLNDILAHNQGYKHDKMTYLFKDPGWIYISHVCAF